MKPSEKPKNEKARINRYHLVLLGLLCLMPALFFWVINLTPLEMDNHPLEAIFGAQTRAELFICGIFFPAAALIFGWLAYFRKDRHGMGLAVMAIGILEIGAGLFALITGSV